MTGGHSLQELSAKGVRFTTQRRILIDIIQSSEQRLDAATLLALARKREPNIDRATVYRTIELLKKHRLGQGLKIGRDRVHLACFQCGRIQEFSSALFERIKGEISHQAAFEVRVIRLEVEGRCQNCKEK